MGKREKPPTQQHEKYSAFRTHPPKIADSPTRASDHVVSRTKSRLKTAVPTQKETTKLLHKRDTIPLIQNLGTPAVPRNPRDAPRAQLVHGFAESTTLATKTRNIFKRSDGNINRFQPRINLSVVHGVCGLLQRYVHLRRLKSFTRHGTPQIACRRHGRCASRVIISSHLVVLVSTDDDDDTALIMIIISDSDDGFSCVYSCVV